MYVKSSNLTYLIGQNIIRKVPFKAFFVGRFLYCRTVHTVLVSCVLHMRMFAGCVGKSLTVKKTVFLI
jgi:hypothetical protein